MRQPRDSDAILPSPGDISNNVRCFGASNFKIPFKTPNPRWYRAPRGSWESPWGEEKAGFGAQPRDSDAILPSPGDISNNVRCFGASNFQMPVRTFNPQWHLASRRAQYRRLGEKGLHFLATPGLFSYIYTCTHLDGKRHEGSPRHVKSPHQEPTSQKPS